MNKNYGKKQAEIKMFCFHETEIVKNLANEEWS